MIKFVKLINGDELVSKVTDNGDSIEVVWPLIIRNEFIDGDSAPRNRLEPYTPHVKGHTVNIVKINVLYIADPIPPLYEYYENNILSSLPKVEKTETETEVVV